MYIIDNSGRLRLRLIAALILLAIGAIGRTGCNPTPQSPKAANGRSPHQTVLPFTGLEWPSDLAVDTAGNVFVTDVRQRTAKGSPDNRLIELPAGSKSQVVLPFTGSGLSVDDDGDVWVVDGGNQQLVKLAAGSGIQTALPLHDLGMRGDIQLVDSAGNVYGTNGGGVDSAGGCCLPVHVVKLAAGLNDPTVLPFTHIDGLGGMAVDTAGISRSTPPAACMWLTHNAIWC